LTGREKNYVKERKKRVSVLFLSEDILGGENNFEKEQF
jgi:hypothetical protein